MLIVLKEKVLTDYKLSQTRLLLRVICFFNLSIGLKRVRKLLQNTEGFETISEPNFLAPICFSPKLRDNLKIFAIWFSLRISRQKSVTENIVENYVAIARGAVPEHDQEKITFRKIAGCISQIILDSEQREFFLKLVSDLPEVALFIPSESQVEETKSNRLSGIIRALMKCANCGVLEKTEKQFQKCSRCGFVFYCSKACQKNDWPNHKQICKEIRKQN